MSLAHDIEKIFVFSEFPELIIEPDRANLCPSNQVLHDENFYVSYNTIVVWGE
jgi:hypothetical protein